MWVEIPASIMEIKIPTEFYRVLERHLMTFDRLNRIQYVVGSKVKVFKGYEVV